MGNSSSFTNITLDWTVPNDLAELNAIVGGKERDFKYKDCQKEMDMINKAFIEIMIEGDVMDVVSNIRFNTQLLKILIGQKLKIINYYLK